MKMIVNPTQGKLRILGSDERLYPEYPCYILKYMEIPLSSKKTRSHKNNLHDSLSIKPARIYRAPSLSQAQWVKQESKQTKSCRCDTKDTKQMSQVNSDLKYEGYEEK